jgi:outer membrane protein OmpA-like peptidoglycan-associated protein
MASWAEAQDISSFSKEDQQMIAKIAMTKSGDYIVVGAYNNYQQAKDYREEIKAYGFDGEVGFSVRYNLFYVYQNGKKDVEKNYARVDDLRNTDEFFDAWLYRLTEDEAIDNYEAAVEASEDGNPEVEPVEVKPAVRDEIEITDEEEHIQEVFDPTIKRWEEKKYNEYRLYLDVRDASTDEPIKGIVEAIDPRVHRLLHNLKSHKTQFLGINKRTQQKVEFETDIFGYRRKLRIIDLSNPETEETQDFVRVSGDSIIIRFDLEAHRAGDRFTMYKVFFHPDAAVMKPESDYELNQLLELLHVNPDYRVRLIGHTNGDGMGKIIKVREDDDQFFKITDNNVKGWGSAKKLSEERAALIKRWLVSHDIDPNRVEVDGMGGKMMLYEEDDMVRAIKNVRVEVEILAN